MSQVHPPTFHQPWRSAAARSEEAAAPAAAPAAPADPGAQLVMQDAAHLRAPAPEQLPMSSFGPTANTPPVALAKRLAEHDAHPDAPAVLPAGRLRIPCFVEVLIPSHQCLKNLCHL